MTIDVLYLFSIFLIIVCSWIQNPFYLGKCDWSCLFQWYCSWQDCIICTAINFVQIQKCTYVWLLWSRLSSGRRDWTQQRSNKYIRDQRITILDLLCSTTFFLLLKRLILLQYFDASSIKVLRTINLFFIVYSEQILLHQNNVFLFVSPFYS